MFEIGFSELLLVAVIGLLVLGPERLPSAVRTSSLWIGRLRRQFNEIRADIEREVGADEIRAQLRNEQIMDQLRESRQALESSARALSAPLEESRAPEAPASSNTPTTPKTEP